MKSLLPLLLFLFALPLFAALYGSAEEGFTIELPEGWSTNKILSKLVSTAVDKDGDVGAKLTAFKSTLKAPQVLNIVCFKTFEDLNFNRKATIEALSKDTKLKGGIRNTNVKLAGMDAAKLEYNRTSGHKMLQYILVSDGKLWSILFVCPETATPEMLKELETISNSFKLIEKK